MTTIDHRDSAGTTEPGTDRTTESCMATLDRGLRVVAANAAMLTTLTPGPRRDLCGTTFVDHLHPNARTTIQRRLERLVTGQDRRFRQPEVTLVADETALSADLSATAFSRDAGGVDSVVVVLHPRGRQTRIARRPARTLTPMDVKILEGVAAGASTHQLAASLYLSRGGIEYHVSSLLKRMRVKNRPALVSKAYSLGVFELGTWPPQVTPQHPGHEAGPGPGGPR